MANPQLEDGHTKIANEIMDALMRVNFSPYERRVLDCILRKTYGWNKKMDRISYTQFEEATGLNRRHIARSLTRLATRNVIQTAGNGHKLEYGLQKDYQNWKSLPAEATLNVTSLGNESLPAEATIDESESLPPGAKSLPIHVPIVTSSGNEIVTCLGKHKSNKALDKSITKPRGYGGDLPEWLDKQTWDAYLEMRRVKKKPATPFAIKLIIGKLEKWRAAGQDVTAILNQSIIATWTDVYEVKEAANAGRKRGMPGQEPSGVFADLEEADRLEHERNASQM